MNNYPVYLRTNSLKKKQITRKLSLNKQTLSLLDAQGMRAVKGGEAIANEPPTPWLPPSETAVTYCCP